MREFIILMSCLITTACNTPTVVETKFLEVKVPVSVPCIDKQRKPKEVTPLNQIYTHEQWDSFTLDQRQKLLMAKAFERKKFGEELTVATSGCP